MHHYAEAKTVLEAQQSEAVHAGLMQVRDGALGT